MAFRSGIYIVPTNRWYIERTVWLIAGFVLLAFTALAVLVNPRFAIGIIVVGVASVGTALTGFCTVGSLLKRFGFTPALGRPGPTPGNLYFMQTDRWYLERRIYLAVGINISIASVLSIVIAIAFAVGVAFAVVSQNPGGGSNTTANNMQEGTLADLIHRMLHKDPARRFPDGAAARFKV